MIQLNLTASARARLWGVAELPHLGGPPTAVHVLRADAGAGPSKSIAIEVAVPRGGITSYGLLGATFESAGGDSLAMSVLSDGDQVFERALAGPPEHAAFGLPGEYVKSIVNGFLGGAAHVARVPSGSIVFDQAAHGILGSSGELFRGLASCVTRLALGEMTPWEIALREELSL